MMTKPKVWHLFIAMCITLLIIRLTLIIDLMSLLFSTIILFVTDFKTAIGQINFELVDYLISGTLIIILPLAILFIFRKRKIFQAYFDFASVVIAVLIFIFIFSPLIPEWHPDFQKNIGLTKLLPPMSSVNYLRLERIEENNQSKLNEYLDLKHKVIKSSFDESIIFADSAQLGDRILYFQNESEFELSSDSLKTNKTIPSMHKKYFLLGTDEYGRDVFSRLVYGARVSIFVGICSVLLSFFIGLLLGSASGYFSGVVDLTLNRLTDTFLSFPTIFLIITILALFGSSMVAVIFVLGFSGWMSLFKIVRSEVMSLKQKDFFISAQMIGLSAKQLLMKEILPVILTPIIVNLVYLFGSVILAEAALSYLGLGTGSNHPSWGSMIDAGQNYLKDAWWMIFFPGLALIITLYSANDLGQKIKVHFNPQLRK